MKAVRVMVHDWAFWCYMGLAIVTICFVAMLAHRNNRQYSKMMEAHEHAQKTMDAIISHNQSADREHRMIERELQILESQRPVMDAVNPRGDGATSN
jgi:Fic family protein